MNKFVFVYFVINKTSLIYSPSDDGLGKTRDELGPEGTGTDVVYQSLNPIWNQTIIEIYWVNHFQETNLFEPIYDLKTQRPVDKLQLLCK